MHVKKKKSTPKKEERTPPKRIEPNVSRGTVCSDKAKATPSPKESRSTVSKENDKRSHKSTKEPLNVQFSESKLQHMKQLAAMLSKKLAKKADGVGTTSEVGNVSTDTGSSSNKKTDGAAVAGGSKTSTDVETVAGTSMQLSSSADESTPNSSFYSGTFDCSRKESSHGALNPNPVAMDASKTDTCDENREKENRCALPVPSEEKTSTDVLNREDREKLSGKSLKRSEDKHAKEPKKHKKHKKHKKGRNAKFEGERVPHLVRSSAMRSEETVDEIAHNSKQDDYVLRKLFSKTGVL